MMHPYFPNIFEIAKHRFEEHLQTPYNHRVIFSGKYGIGKTRFLENFFDPENQNHYTVYRLSPVNYSISPTEDIIQYIKYDIISQFLEKGEEFESIPVSFWKALPAFLRKDLDKVAATLVYMIPKVGKDVVEAFERVQKLREKFKQFKVARERSTSDEFADFLDQIEQKVGSIYSQDIITRLIAEVVSHRKNPILIIDDLDRLDPEHIFRILNVFSAHLHHGRVYQDHHRYGFQKIILACDYDNIRNVFYHRYGEKADFDGYMDKFCSHEVFQLDNKDAILTIITDVISTVKFRTEPDGRDVPEKLVELLGFIPEMITAFIRVGALNLRSILKLYNREIRTIPTVIRIGNVTGGVPYYQLPICAQLRILCYLFSDTTSFLSAVKKCEQQDQWVERMDAVIGHLLVILSYNQHNYVNNQSRREYAIKWEEQGFLLTPEFSGQSAIAAVKTEGWNDVSQKKPHYQCTPTDFWRAMYQSIIRLRVIRYID